MINYQRKPYFSLFRQLCTYFYLHQNIVFLYHKNVNPNYSVKCIHICMIYIQGTLHFILQKNLSRFDGIQMRRQPPNSEAVDDLRKLLSVFYLHGVLHKATFLVQLQQYQNNVLNLQSTTQKSVASFGISKFERQVTYFFNVFPYQNLYITST